MKINLGLQDPVANTSTRTASIKLAFTLVTMLFFMWGFSHGLLDVLNHHFQQTLNISRTESGFIQTAYFGAYFIVALPIGLFIERFGHKSGILIGLLLFSLGALAFVPASWAGTFGAFLIALFVLACGLACLEVTANLYAAALGSPQTSIQRLNFAQSFNGLGVFLGPMIGGSVLYAPPINIAGEVIAPTSLIYVCLATVVFLLLIVFAFIALPDLSKTASTSEINSQTKSDPSKSSEGLWRNTSFTFALLAQFCNIGAYVGIGAFFINFTLEHWAGITPQYSAYLLSLSMLGYMIGRFSGTWLMQYITPRNLLIINSLACTGLCLIAMMGFEKISVFAVMGMYFFMSIMYPTIFGMGVHGLGKDTNRGGSYLVMTLVGAAILPLLMGLLADSLGTAQSFAIPLLCYIVVAAYGISQQPIKSFTSRLSAQ